MKKVFMFDLLFVVIMGVLLVVFVVDLIDVFKFFSKVVQGVFGLVIL